MQTSGTIQCFKLNMSYMSRNLNGNFVKMQYEKEKYE